MPGLWGLSDMTSFIQSTNRSKNRIWRKEMDKFWGWMYKKNYAFNDKSNWLFDERGLSTIPTKQMLIGYMIEYLIEDRILGNGMLVFHIGHTIEEIFETLKKIIRDN